MSNDINSVEQDTKDDVRKISAFRRFSSQLVATSVKNLLLFDMGMCAAFPGIIIPALTGITNEHNLNETLSLTSEQASWLGSIAFVCEPLGSVLSALITDPVGRKKGMMIVNIPLVIAWFMMYNATQVWHIFVANSLLGLGVGLMESPIITYVGEICEPSYRGILIAYTNVMGSTGMLLVLVLNTLMPWRMVGLICMCMPIITVIALCFIPETPLWLLSKNRTTEAEKALCWLRGWVTSQAVANEFQSLQRYSQHSKSCNSCIKLKQMCPHPLPTMVEKLRELSRKKTLKPFFIVVAVFIIAEFTGITGMSPFTVQIFKAYGSPIAPDRAMAIMGFVNHSANVVFLCLIRFTGKRKLYLTMLTVVVLSSAIVSCYGFAVLPSGHNSFDQSLTFQPDNKNLTYIPFVSILVWSFCSYCGVNSIPWQMLSEVFPFKARGAAAGISAAFDYFISFISTKTYYNLEVSLSMPGFALLSCIIAGCGLVLMYKIMPETENRSLEDIEMHFSDNSKKLTDRKIAKQQHLRRCERKNEVECDEITKNSGLVKDQYEIDSNDEIKTTKGLDNRAFVEDV